MLTIIACVLGLYVFQCFLAPLSRLMPSKELPAGQALKVALGPRDKSGMPKESVMGERASRAFSNLRESLFIFLPLALLGVHFTVAEGLMIQGAWLFFGARVVYIPAYLSGIPGVRSLVWMIACAGMVLMAVGLSQA